MSFDTLLYSSSCQLVELNSRLLPVNYASGTIIRFKGKKILLTVFHATGNQNNWALQLEYIPKKGTKNFQLGPMNFLMKVHIQKQDIEDVDLSYVEIPESIEAFRQEIEFPNKIKNKVGITVHETDLSKAPELNANYGFCGMVMPETEEHFGNIFVDGTLRIYEQIRFVRTENDYYVFELPFDHPGHKHFEGCSGAPVIDEDGNIVGLVCYGNDETNEIFVIALTSYKLAIEAFLDADS